MTWQREVQEAVEAAGGFVTHSADGHLKVHGRDGRFLWKFRAHGGSNRTANRAGRSVLRQVVRRVEGLQP